MSSNNRWHRIIFYVMGGISVILILLTGYRTYIAQIDAKKASDRLDKTIQTIANMSEETVRIGQLNTELQEHLLNQSKTITALSEQAIKTTTGGDSFGYLKTRNKAWSPDSWIPIFVNEGKYPLYGVKARIVDAEKWKKITNPPSMSLKRV